MALNGDEPEDGMRITLLDSNNLPVLHCDKPLYLFHRNEEQHLRHRRQGYFNVPDFLSFSQDNYILMVPNSFRAAKMKMLVQDDRDDGPLNKRRRAPASGPGWPERFKQTVVPLNANDSYPLCGVNDQQVYPPKHDRPPFRPVDIILQPR